MSTSISGKILLAEAIGAGVAEVPEDARIGQFADWDSIAHLRLILALEAAVGRQLDPDEAVAIETLGDIDALIGATIAKRVG